MKILDIDLIVTNKKCMQKYRKLIVIYSFCDTKWLFCISIRKFWSYNKNIAFFIFCLIWGVENCAKLFLKVSWKPRNWKNRSTHQIDWNPIIPHFQHGVLTTFLSITFQILILEYRYCYFWILQRLGYWKMYKHTFQDVLEAEKGAKQKWVLLF